MGGPLSPPTQNKLYNQTKHNHTPLKPLPTHTDKHIYTLVTVVHCLKDLKKVFKIFFQTFQKVNINHTTHNSSLCNKLSDDPKKNLCAILNSSIYNTETPLLLH